MRQVPAKTHYLIIGHGRMAKHFCHYLNLLHIPYTQWSRKSHTEDELQAFAAQASHILLLISDASIETFSRKLSLNNNQILVHFSGQLCLENVISAHPLYTFTQDLYPLENYLTVPFIIEENSLPFEQLLPGLTNNAYRIPRYLKAYYHALCVLSANFTCILWQKFFKELHNTFGFDEKVGLPYLRQTFQNLIHNPQGSLTGPLARNDQKTLLANMNALKNDPFLPVYEAFVKAFNEEMQHECA
ncbi:MAG: DUF2520 domain-containing protein [Proteobacteria bacterium]|nr:DUF2520 domain-containing protein [Pseudomonadota bacterium]